MPNRLRKGSRIGVFLPFQNATKEVHTAQGKYTVYAVLICGLIGAILLKPVAFIIQSINPTTAQQDATDLALMIVIGICAGLAVILMLKMQAIMSAIENRRSSTFNERMKNRKESIWKNRD
jgi:hypothetical protein